MIRILANLLLFVLPQTTLAQNEADSLKSEITTFELIGLWKNMVSALEEHKPKSYKNGLGTVSENRISIPMMAEVNNPLIQLEADGNLRCQKYTSARWKKSDGNHLIITTEFGAQYIGLVTKDISNNTYLLTFDGETYKKWK